MIRQAFYPQSGTGIADCKNLSMGGWVVQFASPVARQCDNSPVSRHDNGSNRYFAPGGGFARLVQRQ